MKQPIPVQRLSNQRIARPRRSSPAAVVSYFGAMQSQEYQAAKWAIALRMTGTTRDDEIERAFDDGEILRTHVLRPTWHFVTPADIRWMLELTAPNVQRRVGTYYARNGLDARTLSRATRTIERALRDGQFLTRAELRACLSRARIELGSLPLMLLMMHAELEGVACSGPRRRKHHTYALLSERVPPSAPLSRDEALATLTRRYFTSHAPATVRDFVWWSGLSTADARRGLDITRAGSQVSGGLTYWSLGRDTGRGTKVPRYVCAPGPHVHLLPIYDEYLVAYRDRDAVPHHAGTNRTGPGSFGTFQHAVVIDGQIAGSWRNTRALRATTIGVTPSRPLTRAEHRALAECAERYGRFLDRRISLSVARA